jgi:hypothetical protein
VFPIAALHHTPFIGLKFSKYGYILQVMSAKLYDLKEKQNLQKISIIWYEYI